MVKLVFFGTPQFAVPSLEALARFRDNKILAVVTQPDKPQGRSLAMKQSPVASAAERLGLAQFKIERFGKSPDAINELAKLAPDVAVVVAYGALLPPAVLQIPRCGALNLHPSLLPKYRGASPIQAAIANGDQETGITIMLLDEEMDHGPILSQTTMPVDADDTAESLAERLSSHGARLLTDTLPRYLGGAMQPHAQDHTQATFTKQLVKEDGRIDWRKSAIEIERMIRAYYPWPGSWTTFAHNGRETKLKIIRATVLKDGAPQLAHSPGTILPSLENECAVTCGDLVPLHLALVQPEGKKTMPGEAFMNGYRMLQYFT